MNSGYEQEKKAEITERIVRLKKERDAVIVAHMYQNAEVQAIADIVGDSFALSKYCAGRPERTIVFCGVDFMAESAKIYRRKRRCCFLNARPAVRWRI